MRIIIELTRNARIVKKVPKGTSAYQSSWILDDHEERSEGDVSSDEDSSCEMMEDDTMAEIQDDDSTDNDVSIYTLCSTFNLRTKFCDCTLFTRGIGEARLGHTSAKNLSVWQ